MEERVTVYRTQDYREPEDLARFEVWAMNEHGNFTYRESYSDQAVAERNAAWRAQYYKTVAEVRVVA